jgi:hypothetical protein
MSTSDAGRDGASPLFCDRCARMLYPGRGDHYVVRIEAVADPSGPVFPEGSLTQNISAELDRTLQRLESLSEQEAMDQVYRRLTLFLCTPCYRQWIEHPTGR